MTDKALVEVKENINFDLDTWHRLADYQREFLAMRALGASVHVALKQIRRKPSTIQAWRYEEDGNFHTIEKSLMKDKRSLIKLCTEEIVKQLGLKVALVYNIVLDRGLEWESLSDIERKEVIKVLAALRGLVSTDEVVKGGYDEMVLRRHYNA